MAVKLDQVFSKENARVTKSNLVNGGGDPSLPFGIPTLSIIPRTFGGGDFIGRGNVPSGGGTPGTPKPMGPSLPTSNPLTAGDIGRGITDSGLCERLNEPWRSICRLGGGVLGGTGTGLPTGGGGGTLPPFNPTGSSDPCRPGTVRVGNQCVAIGDAFPGGNPMLTPAGDRAVIGGFGLPAVTPAVVGQVFNKRGELSMIRRCPSMMVLGRDELCYPKALLPRRSKLRKHRPPPRPPMTGADAAALRRIGTLQNRVKGLARDAGLSCGTRARRRK